MKRKNKKYLWGAIFLLVAFTVWTVLLLFVDVKPIGPEGSQVGFAALNARFHQLTGVHTVLYELTDWLSLIPLGFIPGFALLGLTQWVKRKQLRRVDYSIFILGGFYIVVLGLYAFFEKVVVNYRPILIGGVLEASYPSSTTMLVLCVIPTAMLQLRDRIRHSMARRLSLGTLALFAAFMVIGRLISGVHWLTDIIGGALLSAGLVMLYHFFILTKIKKPL